MIAIIIDKKIDNVKLFYELDNLLDMLTKHLGNKAIIKPVCAIIEQEVLINLLERKRLTNKRELLEEIKRMRQVKK